MCYADLFGSFAESTCAALVLSSVTPFGHDQQLVPMLYPLLLSAGMLLSCLVTTILATDVRPATSVASIEPTLKVQVSVSNITVLGSDGLEPIRRCCDGRNGGKPHKTITMSQHL